MAAAVLVFLPQLDSFRASVSENLALPPAYLAVGVFAASFAIILVLAQKLHHTLTKPIKEIADACASGQLVIPRSAAQTREIRIIKEYLRQVQDRADNRAEQIQRMERELIATRRERDRSFRRLEEYEDLLASYKRIYSELDIDNKALRKELSELHAKNEILRQEIKGLKKQQGSLSLEFLNELILNSQEISELSQEITKQWERRSLSSIRDSLLAISEKCEAQKASIENVLSQESNREPTAFPIRDDLQKILDSERAGRFELQMNDDELLISSGQNEQALTFLRSFSRLLSEQVAQGRLAIDVENQETPSPFLSLTVQTENFIGEAITPETVSELARQHGVHTDAIDTSDNKLRLSLPLQQLQSR